MSNQISRVEVPFGFLYRQEETCLLLTVDRQNRGQSLLEGTVLRLSRVTGID